MGKCAGCGSELAGDGRFCARCGRPSNADATPTRTVAVATSPPSSYSSSSASSSDGRFLPGALLAGRYRIVALLGRGGMGEVYRADDLTLGQQVALKFLPEVTGENASASERFRNEVRLARQVSDRHVCRVYDVGDIDGNLFLSMEYVDGEDLAS